MLRILPRRTVSLAPIFIGLCIFVFLCKIISPCGASEIPSTILQARIATDAPPVTGTLKDLASPTWHDGLHVSAFHNFTSRVGSADSTEALLVFGPKSIYCAFIVSQAGIKITANQMSDNIGLGLDDYVSVMFDTSGGDSSQYFFAGTPRGTRYQKASESTRYRPNWSIKASIVSNDRWLVEMVIPYRFLRGSTNNWRINFSRFIASRQTIYTWAYEAKMTDPYDPLFWPSIHGCPDLRARRTAPTAQIYAIGVGGTDRRLFQTPNGIFTQSQPRQFGMDLSVPLTSSLNFDGTINPDYSNLESDQQIISPQEFRFQYSEFRPFFTQGANYLPGPEIYYSPTIGSFDHGEKLEGQIGNETVGILDTGGIGESDNAFDVTYNMPNRELSFTVAGAGAVRSQRSDEVREVAFSGLNLNSSINYGASEARELDSLVGIETGNKRDTAFLGVSKPNYSAQLTYLSVGPNYNPIDAYIPANDIKGFSASGTLMSSSNENRFLRNELITGNVDRFLDGSGAVRESDFSTSANLEFNDLSSISVTQSLSSFRNYRISFPVYLSGATNPYNQTTASYSTGSAKPSSANITFSWGNYANFYLHQLNAFIDFKVGHRLTIEANYGSVLESGLTSSDGQDLRRFTLFDALSRDESLSLAYRSINGNGGFSSPGRNFTLSYHRRNVNGSSLQFEFGSPASIMTLNRYLVKYNLSLGSGTGE